MSTIFVKEVSVCVCGWVVCGEQDEAKGHKRKARD